jgi:hypothetical protein
VWITRQLPPPHTALTPEERTELEELAEWVSKTDLCSRLFPAFIQSFESATGQTHSAAVRSIAKGIEKLDRKGLDFSPSVVARVLREYVKRSP